jgi:hypothetical protein
MQESEPGPAPRRSPSPSPQEFEDADMKKLDEKKAREYEEEEDIELSEKKDRPPRFSTLFEPTAPPQIVERYIQPKKKSGVYIPTPLFVVLAIVLLFESTLLFAYTLIGLYNNLPNGVLPFGGSSSAITEGCNCADRGSINISPNFIMPGAEVDGFTLTTATPSTIKPTPTESPSASISTVTDPAGFLESALSAKLATETSNPAIVSTTKVVVKTPSQKVVEITTEATVTAGQSTSTAVVTLPPKSSTNEKRATPASDDGSGETAGGDAVATPSTLVTSASPPPTTDLPSPTEDDEKPDKTTDAAEGTNGACFGAGGAVWQNCV